MAIHDFKSQRLFVEGDLTQGTVIEANRNQANYLLNVLRLKGGSGLLLFNGRQGEWKAQIQSTGRKRCDLLILEPVRPQPQTSDLAYCFAPLKQARLDYLVQKVTEMGVSRLIPVITQNTQVRKLNMERLRANTIEAAEQCGVLAIPELSEPVKLENLPDQLGADTHLFFCDESQPAGEPSHNPELGNRLAVLVGPEGGFTPDERHLIGSWPSVSALGLGPRILRADTAAVAALALVQSQYGDWYQ